MSWGAVNARARGLATHLLGRERLRLASSTETWEATVRQLAGAGYPLASGEQVPTGEEVDRAAAELVRDRFAMLGRWLGKRNTALAVFSEEAEYRTLRRLLRGAAQGASPGARLLGTAPTERLAARALDRLAQADTPAELIRQLLKLGHPAGRALRSASRGGQELWRLEAALAQLFAVRVSRAARSGGRWLRRFAALLVDVENVSALLRQSEWGPRAAVDEVFLPGGLLIGRDRFATAAALPPDQRTRELSRWLARSPLAPLAAETAPLREFESRALAVLLAWLHREARRDPLSPAVTLEVLERIRAEAHDVRLVCHAARLGAPAGLVAAALVTPQ